MVTQSKVNILVEFEPGHTLTFDFFTIEAELTRDSWAQRPIPKDCQKNQTLRPCNTKEGENG